MHISKRLFEFEDLEWFPSCIRNGMTNYLHYLFEISSIYQPALALLEDGLAKTQSHCIVDLCSGGGGAAIQLTGELSQNKTSSVQLCLTDKFPNLQRDTNGSELNRNNVISIPYSVDAAAVPASLRGFRTMFSAFHHFDKPAARAVIQDAVRANEGIAVFDGGTKNIPTMLLMLIFHPIALFILTPFFKKVKLSQIFFTYLVPLIPLCTVWDGIISIMRLYQPHEMLILAKQVDHENYCWKAGKMKTRFGMSMAYLIGYPDR